MGSSKFLGYVVSRRGIQANSDQVSTLLDLAEPRVAKLVQYLTGMITALSRFISKSTDRYKPFFRLLEKKRKFMWGDECSVAFQGIKDYLSSPPCL